MPEPWTCPLPTDEECPHANERDYLLEELEALRYELKSYKDFMEDVSKTHGTPNSQRYKERVRFLERLNKILDSNSRYKQKQRT